MNAISNGTNSSGESLSRMLGDHSIVSVIFLPNMNKPTYKGMLYKPKLRDNLQKNLQKCQGHESQGKSEELSRLKDTEDTCAL